MTSTRQTQVLAVAIATRERLTQDPEWLPTAQCVPASRALRADLRAAGVSAHLRPGYFVIESPDPETCACASGGVDHWPLCYLPPHAWVETDDFLMDITGDQFNDNIFGEALNPIEVHPLNVAGRWFRSLPAGVHGPGAWSSKDLHDFQHWNQE